MNFTLLSLSLPTVQEGELSALPDLSPVHSEEVAATLAAQVSTLSVRRPLGLSIICTILDRAVFEQEASVLEQGGAVEKIGANHHKDPYSLSHRHNDEDEDEDEEDEDEDNAEGEAQNQGNQQRHQDSSRKKKHVNLLEEDLKEDWYDILKVPQGEGATEAEIRAAYRQRCLETHPDKDPNHSDVLFKKVQRGFDILGDPDIRQTYDSARPFDDSIPEETEVKQITKEDDFFKLFSAVFDRNKKWSTDPASLPSLGTSKTPYAQVVQFYNRWSSYRSWRDFSHLVELQEVSEDMCREEKRYYTRENERELSRFKKEEMNRIKTLVERAKKYDPRVRRHLQAEEAKREKDRQEREAFRAQIREAAERKRLEEQEAAKQRAQEEQRERENAKQKIAEEMQRLAQFFSSHGMLDDTPAKKLLPNAVRQANIKWLFSKLTTTPIGAVSEMVDGILSRSTIPQPLSAATQEGVLSPSSSPNAPSSPVQRRDDADAACTEVPAVLAFNAALTRKEQELGVNRYGEAIKTRLQDKPKTKPAAPEAPSAVWTDEDLSRLQKATAKYPPGTVERWAKIITVLRDKFTEAEAMAKVSELTAALHAGGAGNTGSSDLAAGKPSAAAATPATQAQGEGVEDWTLAQQKQLENGLRQLKDYKEKDKFQRIAKDVEGKNAKQCFERYKYLCSLKKR